MDDAINLMFHCPCKLGGAIPDSIEMLSAGGHCIQGDLLHCMVPTAGATHCWPPPCLHFGLSFKSARFILERYSMLSPILDAYASYMLNFSMWARSSAIPLIYLIKKHLEQVSRG